MRLAFADSCFLTLTLAMHFLAWLKSSLALCTFSGSFSTSKLMIYDLLPLSLCFVDIVDSNFINPTCHEGAHTFLKCSPSIQLCSLTELVLKV